MPTSLITVNTLLVLVGLCVLVVSLVLVRMRVGKVLSIGLIGVSCALIAICLASPLISAQSSALPASGAVQAQGLQNGTAAATPSAVSPSATVTLTPFNTPTTQPSLTPTMSETPIVLYTPIVYVSTYALTTPTSCSVIAKTMTYLRSDPSETMASIGTIFAGSYLNVTGRIASKQWWQVISTDGDVSIEGWVRADYVTADSACTDSAVPVIGPTETPTKAKVGLTGTGTAAPCTLLTTTAASLRSDPSLKQVPLAQVPAGTAFTSVKKSADGRWWNVTYGGQDGWIGAGAVFVSASCSAVLVPTPTSGTS